MKSLFTALVLICSLFVAAPFATNARGKVQAAATGTSSLSGTWTITSIDRVTTLPNGATDKAPNAALSGDYVTFLGNTVIIHTGDFTRTMAYSTASNTVLNTVENEVKSTLTIVSHDAKKLVFSRPELTPLGESTLTFTCTKQ